MKHTFPISRLPFHVRSFEEGHGKVRSAEELCPGVYNIRTGPIPPHSFLGSDLIVVMSDSPVIPAAAKAYGTPLKADPKVLVYYDEDYFDKARWVITYEIDKYLAEHDLPLLDDGSLVEDQARGMEVCPEYFGQFPVPTETPWGPRSAMTVWQTGSSGCKQRKPDGFWRLHIPLVTTFCRKPWRCPYSIHTTGRTGSTTPAASAFSSMSRAASPFLSF